MGCRAISCLRLRCCRTRCWKHVTTVQVDACGLEATKKLMLVFLEKGDVGCFQGEWGSGQFQVVLKSLIRTPESWSEQTLSSPQLKSWSPDLKAEVLQSSWLTLLS